MASADELYVSIKGPGGHAATPHQTVDTILVAAQLIQSLQSLGAGRRALFRFVYLPASLPAILTALRQSIGTAVAVLYISELFATKYGLGYYIYYQGSTLFNYPAMYAGVVAMSLLGLGMYFGVDWLERKWCRWKFVS